MMISRFSKKILAQSLRQRRCGGQIEPSVMPFCLVVAVAFPPTSPTGRVYHYKIWFFFAKIFKTAQLDRL
jgi:hypothetical protein